MIGSIVAPLFSQEAFTPPRLPGLTLWLDASGLSGSDGDPVTTWTDLSGQGNHATQSTTAAKPTFKTNIVNGRAAVLFDGVDDSLDVPANVEALLQTSTKSVFVAVKWVTLVNSARLLTLATSGTPAARFSMLIVSGFDYYVIYTDGAAQQAITLTGVDPSISAAQLFDVIQNGTAITGYVNGVSGGSANNAGTEVPNAFGAIGSNQGGSGFANAYICEIVAYNTALSAADAARVRNYLTAKWSIS